MDAPLGAELKDNGNFRQQLGGKESASGFIKSLSYM
jgi:hypothetical protein